MICGSLDDVSDSDNLSQEDHDKHDGHTTWKNEMLSETLLSLSAHHSVLQ